MTPSHPADPEAKPEQIPDVSKLSEAFGAVLARDSAARATLTAGTPETDSVTIWLSETGISNDDKSPFVRREVARQLEKDRNALRGQVEKYKNQCALAGVGDFKGDYFMGHLTTTGNLRQQLAAANAALEEARRERDEWKAQHQNEERYTFTLQNLVDLHQGDLREIHVALFGEAFADDHNLNAVNSIKDLVEFGNRTKETLADLRAQLDAAKKAGEELRKIYRRDYGHDFGKQPTYKGI